MLEKRIGAHFRALEVHVRAKTRPEKCSRSVWSILENLDYGIEIFENIKKSILVLGCIEWYWMVSDAVVFVFITIWSHSHIAT